MATKGIDISRYQGAPDFGKLKNEVDFVILQAVSAATPTTTARPTRFPCAR